MGNNIAAVLPAERITSVCPSNVLMPESNFVSSTFSARTNDNNSGMPGYDSKQKSANNVESLSAVNDNTTDICLISFDDFIACGAFPRNPDLKNLCKDYSCVDRNHSMIIFISHSWLRGYNGAEGWDGRPHPDTAAADKFNLTVEGIAKIMNVMAPGMKQCYIWMDFMCTNQDGDPAKELKQFDQIIKNTDCIFTPIYDKNADQWRLPATISNCYTDYQSPGWNDNTNGYINRAWCRLEVQYAATIPTFNDSTRIDKFALGLKQHLLVRRRPHFLYGSREQFDDSLPLLLPQLIDVDTHNMEPLQGHVTYDSDRNTIQDLQLQLQKYIKPVSEAKTGTGPYREGYTGKIDNHGEMQGIGIYVLANGDIYEGEWMDGYKHGKGRYTYANGDIYDGDWKKGLMHGQGLYIYSSGDIYQGEFRHDKKHGTGFYQYVSCDTYDGSWKDGFMHGQGVYTYADGEVYSGSWKDGHKHGRGHYNYLNGSSYDGEYKYGNKHGNGTYSESNGAVYTGHWKEGNMHGHGVLVYPDGSKYTGHWCDDKRHGHGIYYDIDGNIIQQGSWTNVEDEILVITSSSLDWLIQQKWGTALVARLVSVDHLKQQEMVAIVADDEQRFQLTIMKGASDVVIMEFRLQCIAGISSAVDQWQHSFIRNHFRVSYFVDSLYFTWHQLYSLITLLQESALTLLEFVFHLETFQCRIDLAHRTPAIHNRPVNPKTHQPVRPPPTFRFTNDTPTSVTPIPATPTRIPVTLTRPRLAGPNIGPSYFPTRDQQPSQRIDNNTNFSPIPTRSHFTLMNIESVHSDLWILCLPFLGRPKVIHQRDRPLVIVVCQPGYSDDTIHAKYFLVF
eukprot:gene3568-7095_t